MISPIASDQQQNDTASMDTQRQQPAKPVLDMSGAICTGAIFMSSEMDSMLPAISDFAGNKMMPATADFTWCHGASARHGK